MQQKTTHCLFTFIFLFIFIIPTVSATSTVSGEINAMGFHYAVLHLAQYKAAVNELFIVSLILLSALIMATIICWLFFRRQKHELNNPAVL
ncbi:hypothetical protein [Lysinibacillus capsici]|uniref:hypothetical protein n=1 Tax=Lysinibacillus capsici TaxID=2115968 RepID=UPI000E20B195|nr:hypothetical protein [Lysinibacillus capsici]RDV30553.1 hypothetical protein C7B89_13830 [Lysinibacillus capsici]WNN77999.1 hypothetical protein RKS58_09195 [Lysinibacillus capsici]